jgi:hypothetical protein
MGALKKENKELRDELKLKNVVLDRYDSELKRYRTAAFLDNGFEGARKYNKELVEILKRRGAIDSYKILETFGIDFTGDSDNVKAVSRQLEHLESYGIVSSTNKGWMWIG